MRLSREGSRPAVMAADAAAAAAQAPGWSRPAVVAETPNEAQTLYEILGVDEDAESDALTKHYRQRALEEHPDKGGDADRFDELVKAFKVLSTQDTRAAYDAELAKSRERSRIVEGGPSRKTNVNVGVKSKVAQKQAEAPMPRQKTEPTPGSKRQGTLSANRSEPGNRRQCADEWKGIMSGGNFLKAITDDITDEVKTERLFQQYAKLPPGRLKKREWVKNVTGQQKVDLKILAKKKEAQERERMKVWLNHGPSGAPVRVQMNKDKRDGKAEAAAGAPAKPAEAGSPVQQPSPINAFAGRTSIFASAEESEQVAPVEAK